MIVLLINPFKPMESQGLSSAQTPAVREEQFETAVPQSAQTVETPTAETAAPVVETTSDTTPADTAAADDIVTVENDSESAAQTANPYAGKNQAELIDLLTRMIDERPVQNLRGDIEAVKIAFYKAGRADIEAQRAAYLAAGGDPEAFQPAPGEWEAKFKELLLRYREKRDAFINHAEQEKERAYAAKLQIIEELKELVNGNETLGQTFNTFRELQQRWKEAGLVPQDKLKDLWETYHHHVENFYNYIKINKELRDLDLKKNYEAKTELAEEAEALMLDPSATNAFHKLQKLHEQWREIGPVAPEYKEALWERFKAASTQINKRHQEYFEGIKAEQKQNLTLKTELCEKVEELAAAAFTTHKEWNAASDQIIEIQKVWKTIGFAPKKDNTKIYERFRSACDKFFEAKRTFYQDMKSEIADNLQAKLDLCAQAEALQESEDWKATTDALIALQKRWKEIGATSRKHSEQVWQRFRAASDHFFARKAAHFGSVDAQYADNLARKEAMLDEMRQRLQEKVDITFDTIKEYQRRWAEIGFVPLKKKEAIQAEYRRVVDGLFALLRGEERERHLRNFKDKISKIQEGGTRKLNQERERLYNKIRQIEGDIQIWENNIGFFAKSKNAEALMKEVQNKIARAKEQIATMTEKIRLIDHPEAVAPEAAEQPTPEETSAPTAAETASTSDTNQSTTNTTDKE